MTDLETGRLTDAVRPNQTPRGTMPNQRSRRRRAHRLLTADASRPAPSARALVALVAVFAAGCGGSHSSAGDVDLPPACTAFVAKYEQCIQASVPSLPAVAKERAAQTRAALEQEARRAVAAPVPNEATDTTPLAKLAATCTTNLQRLSTSCGPSRTN